MSNVNQVPDIHSLGHLVRRMPFFTAHTLLRPPRLPSSQSLLSLFPQFDATQRYPQFCAPHAAGAARVRDDAPAPVRRVYLRIPACRLNSS